MSRDYKWEGKKAFWRGVEVVFTAAEYAWGWFFPDPKIIKGPGAIKQLPAQIKADGKKKVLVVTDKVLMSLNLLDGLFEAMKKEGVDYVVYDEVQPNPSIENVEAALKLYKDNGCEAIVAVGGGSPMDCAKGVGARVARPTSTVKQLGAFVFMVAIPVTSLPKVTFNGYFPPKLYAVPTTAGTGSETTIAAVITDMQTHDKFPITDPLIRANVAVLDPELTTGLPKKVTSTTGLDALTHAVEGYTNIWYNDKKFNELGKDAVVRIFKWLEVAYNEPNNLKAREEMLQASYNAGMCFTRGGVGYVHGIGHRLGGLYGIPHGLAMSTILTHVFSDDFLFPYTYEKLAELADAVGITGASKREKAKKFIAEIRAMEDRMEIPYGFDCIRDEDIPLIAERCMKETNPTYPVPHIFTKEDLEVFIKDHLQIKN
ncbi:MAG: iron-containing alcohol dehydrogenase [Clostridia bacterium]|jgi:Alcohol dehydrogenase, class IV|nr:iron-containing alcohol dehydrogenase [Oscillospiraceae bacterium]MBQ1663238.1 iron-containing alcohol dehydrogenase [Clostridia bacterium]MBQ3050985.1 iron-containing alcohol dehydrogenase [Clostridia bacterium]MBQ3326682.1 iron-containing alcohol dehydrogenase [Clostridia bacterium]MBQ4458963.1 iron-containing alcohol dehydrogenase [Clostridia bacterium]